MHWAAKYIGKPWRPAARGPEAFDCWGLVMAVYRECLGIELPEFNIDPRDRIAAARAIDAGPMLPIWQRLEKPEHLCAVGMGGKILSHVGVYLSDEGGMVLHAVDRCAVVADSMSAVKTLYRFNRLEFFRHGAHRIC